MIGLFNSLWSQIKFTKGITLTQCPSCKRSIPAVHLMVGDQYHHRGCGNTWTFEK